VFLAGQPRPTSRGQAHPIFWGPPINTHRIWPKTTNFGVVTHVGSRGVFLGGQRCPCVSRGESPLLLFLGRRLPYYVYTLWYRPRTTKFGVVRGVFSGSARSHRGGPSAPQFCYLLAYYCPQRPKSGYNTGAGMECIRAWATTLNIAQCASRFISELSSLSDYFMRWRNNK